MKYRILVLLLFIVQFSFGQNHKYIHLSKEYDHVLLEEFISNIVLDNDVTFYYNPEWIDSIYISTQADSICITELLNGVLFNETVGFYISKSNVVYLIPQKNFIESLPFHSVECIDVEGSEVDVESSGYLKGRYANSKITIVIGEQGYTYSYRKVKISGKLTDAENGDDLVGATMFIKDTGQGAASNAQGVISLKIRPGTYSVVFNSVGMKEVKCAMIVHGEGKFSLEMEKRSQEINEVLVTQKTQKRGSKSGMESVDYMTMKEIPSLMGEKDVLRIAQMLPGIVSVGEGSGGINVRGGNADQNLFYVNSIPVYNSSHLFGFFSSINSNIVDQFTVYKGQVPVKYGGRLSSVFDVETRKGNKTKFFTEGAVSPISANIVLETPIVKEKASLSFSTRSTYSNWILGQTEDATLRNSDASFYDVSLGFDYSLSDHDHFNIFAYYSNDYFSLNKLTDYTYGNAGASVRYIHRFSKKIKATGSLINSKYRFGTIEQNNPTEAYEHNYSINHNEVKIVMDWLPNDNHEVSFGVNSILYNLSRGTVFPYGAQSLMKTVSLGNETGIESAFFIGDKLALGSRLNIYAGMRYSVFSQLGPIAVNLYADNKAKIESNIVDSLVFNSNEPVITYHGSEFRAGFDFNTSINGTLKFTFTQMRQYLFMLSNTVSIAPTDQWKLSDYHIKPQSSYQSSLGYYHDFSISGVSASAEIYYKQSANIVEYKDGANFLSTPNVESIVLQGDQQAYGAEFMLSKDVGRLNGWISYVYARSFVTIDGDNDWENINLGRPYASNYDKPHVMNLVMNYKINRRFSISSNVVYNTGRPLTLPVGYYFVEGYPYIDYSSRNEYRIPDYLRMDFSIKIEGNLKRKKAMHSYWMFSVYNLTGRNNANSVFFRSEDDIIKGYQYSIIGVPIYTISWNWKLGNYENK